MIIIYWLWRLGVLLTDLVPRRISFFAASALGTTLYFLMPFRRRIAEENFSYVLHKSPGDAHVRRVARHSFRNYARYLRDVMLYPRTSLAELEERIHLHGEEHIARALAMNRGAIFVSAHYGNMDMPSALVAMRYKPMTLVAETLEPQQLMDFLTRMRSSRNVHLYPYDIAPRKMVEALRRNEIIGMLLDFGVTHHLNIRTVTVNFFGAPTRFPSGPAQLARLSRAPIVVVSTRVGADGKIGGYIEEPILVRRTQNREHDLQVTMQEIAHRLEAIIRIQPEQWYVFRPMWDNGNSRFKIPNSKISKRQPNFEF